MIESSTAVMPSAGMKNPELAANAEQVIREIVARRNAIAQTRSQYEGAKRWSTERSYLPGFVQDARFDATAVDRHELVRKSRFFEHNDALANRLGEVFVEFTVGAYGPPMTPASSDDDWNQRNGDMLREVSPNLDIEGGGYAGLFTIAAWREFFDGEYFLLKTGTRANPQLRGIPSHRVGTPPEQYDQEGKTIIDGVAIDSQGRKLGYWIQEGIDADKFTFRKVNEVVHLVEPLSPGQYRGVPFLAPVMNDLHDFSDLFLLEMQAAKVQSKDAVFWETQSGELPDPMMMRKSFGGPTPKPLGQHDPQDYAARQAQLQKVFGGRAIAGKMGEKMQFLASNRPSVTSQWFFDYLASRICAGVGISKLLVFPWSIQGTVVRSDLDLARNYFLSRFTTFAAAAREVYLYVVGAKRFTDLRIADAPHDWMKVNIRPPRAVNVDVGRNSAATIAELDSCLTTFEEQFAMRGLDYREQVRQRAREEAFIDQVAGEFKIVPGRLRSAITEALKAGMQQEAKRREEEDLITA